MAEGAKGPIVARVARVRVYLSRDGLPVDEQVWLFLRKNADGQIKYAISNAPKQIALKELIRAATMRWPIEQCFQEGKDQLGMDHYEHRSWPAWHRHMTYVFLALHLLLRLRLKFKKTPLLTVPLVRRLLATVLPMRSLTMKGAIEIVAYHLKRNLTAYESHRKKRKNLAATMNANVALSY